MATVGVPGLDALENRLLLSAFTNFYGGAGNQAIVMVTGSRSGTVFGAGNFDGQFDARAGKGKEILKPSGFTDAFVVAVNAKGKFQWKLRYGEADSNDQIYDIFFHEPTDTLWVAGASNGPDGLQGWVSKVDEEGDRKFTWTYQGFSPSGIEVHEKGVYVIGRGQGVVSIGGQTSGEQGDTQFRGIVTRIGRGSGKAKWLIDVDTSLPSGQVGFDQLYFSREHDEVVVGGSFSGDDVSFDPLGNDPRRFDAGASSDAFVAAFAPGSGTLNWYKQFKSDSADGAITIGGLDTFPNGDVVAGINFRGPLIIGSDDFDGEAQPDCGITRMRGGNGRFIRTKVFGGDDFDLITGVYVAPEEDEVFIAGAHAGTADLKPGKGKSNHTAVGQVNTFVIETDTQFKFQEAFTIEQSGPTGFNEPRGFYPLGNEQFVLGILYTGTIDFPFGDDPGPHEGEALNEFILYAGTYELMGQ
jgi:hypothetical protein